MKLMSKFLAISIVLLAFSAATFAQVTATATANATIIVPITITKTADLNFGNLYVSATVAGTAVITPAGARSATGGVGMAPGGTVGAASFTVQGITDAVYTITIPSADHTINSGANTMTVNVFQSNPTPTGTLTLGTSTLTVGATLNVNAAQVGGIYASATPFDVTVNYQ
jgi:hypothetical protein